MNRIRQPYSRHTDTMATPASILPDILRASARGMNQNHQRRMELEFCRPYDWIEAAQLRLYNRWHADRIRQALEQDQSSDWRNGIKEAIGHLYHQLLRLTGKHQWA